MLVCVFKNFHDVTGDDGCTATWSPGDTIIIQPNGGTLDYVRKGVIVPIGEGGHLHIVPASLLDFFNEVDGTRTRVSADSLLRISA